MSPFHLSFRDSLTSLMQFWKLTNKFIPSNAILRYEYCSDYGKNMVLAAATIKRCASQAACDLANSLEQEKSAGKQGRPCPSTDAA
ncbi:hypothetical protein [Nitrosomonas ureae]|uniref:hypothetical protein n=1 Tax=Nitrosomonas ureae TaxID=44577 RepID=UPI001160DF5C|nr:hypothetical protein [Nitrosomonas ureae]